MKDINMTPPPETKSTKSGKIPLSDLAIGPARGGPMDSLILRTKGMTLKQWVGSLHGWVKE
jgi:hypothetical protein